MVGRILLVVFSIWTLDLAAQGIIEAEKVVADSMVGDGSRLTGLPNQFLSVSPTGDTLQITEGNFVIIPGISQSNSGTAFANAGADIVNACQTSVALKASKIPEDGSGEWSIISGTGGSFDDVYSSETNFSGVEGETYTLQWRVQHSGGSSSFDQTNVSIAVNTETSVADAGSDQLAVMTQSVFLDANFPQMGSEGEWEVLEGNGGVLHDSNDPTSQFTGIPGTSYTLQWRHFNDCSTSSDEVIISFNESASGTPSVTGRYYIPDQRFRQYLQVAYPSIMDGDSMIIAMANVIDKIDLRSLNVSNLDGLQYFTGLIIFRADGDFTVIPSFSDVLEVFECNADLQVIPAFPSTLDTLILKRNVLNQLPQFPEGLRYLRLTLFDDLSITNLPVSLEYLWIYCFFDVEVELVSIPGTCKELFISAQPYGLNLPSINIPDQCTNFELQRVRLGSFPELPMDKSNLENLVIPDADVYDMPSLELFTDLENLNLSGNNLLKLSLLPPNISSINIDDNPLICVENKPPGVADALTAFEICPE